MLRVKALINLTGHLKYRAHHRVLPFQFHFISISIAVVRRTCDKSAYSEVNIHYHGGIEHSLTMVIKVVLYEHCTLGNVDIDLLATTMFAPGTAVQGQSKHNVDSCTIIYAAIYTMYEHMSHRRQQGASNSTS